MRVIKFLATALLLTLVASPAWAQVEDTVRDLEVDKQADPVEVEVGERVIFDIEVTNDTAAAANIVVEDELPDGVTLVSVRRSEGGTCEIDRRTVRCEFTAVPIGETRTVQLVVEPTATGRIENTATAVVVVGGVPDETTRQSDSARITVEGTSQPNPPPPPNPVPVVVIVDENTEQEEDGGDSGEDEEDGEDNSSVESETSTSTLEDEDEGTTGKDIGEDTTGEFNDNNTPGAVADSSTGEASTPGAVAQSDPDEQAPVSQEQVEEQGGEVVDEVQTTGPLPETGGASLVYLLMPLAGCALLALTLVRRRR